METIVGKDKEFAKKVGTRKRNTDSGVKRKLTFNEFKALDNSKQEGAKRTEVGITKQRKKSSPRKLNKGKGRGKSVKVTFIEDDSQVVLEVERCDKDFPLESDAVNLSAQADSQNNNATVVAQSSTSMATGRKSRADKFREMVSTASAASEASDEDENPGSQSGNMDKLNRNSRSRSVSRSQPSSTEEGETQSSEDSDDSDSESDTSSVKIRPRTAEEIAQEEAEYDKATEKIVNKTVDKTLERLTQFMRDSGVVFVNLQIQGKRGDNGCQDDRGDRDKMRSRTQKSKHTPHRKEGNDDSDIHLMQTNSETTIYDNAIEQMSQMLNNDSVKEIPDTSEVIDKNRISTSSEELGDTSNELTEQINCMGFVPDTRSSRGKEGQSNQFYEQAPMPGGSSQDRNRSVNRPDRETERSARNKADQLVRDAEASKARILDPTGNYDRHNLHLPNVRMLNFNARRRGVQDDGYESDEDPDVDIDNRNNPDFSQHHPALIDENYLVIGNHVEEHIRQRIENGEYVDFSRLLPWDRLLADEDNCMEIVNRNGRTYFVPASDPADTGSISNFSRWEKAFRVFSNIYTQCYPGRSSELIQYNHIIHTAALTYTWENVYLYDRDFRHHISRFPHRSWAVILQQAWTMRLKDRNRSEGGKQGSRAKGNKDICWRYNSGRCTFGKSCKFEHRCAICNKYGHGAHICRKANGMGSSSSHYSNNDNNGGNGGNNSVNSNWQDNSNANKNRSKGHKHYPKRDDRNADNYYNKW